jgi:hypothetical protein
MPAIRERSAGTVHEKQFNALLADARAGRDIAEAAVKLGRDLELPHPVAVRGFDQSAMVGIGGIGSGHPVPETFGCPARECSRSWIRQPGMAAPECHLHGGRLA